MTTIAGEGRVGARRGEGLVFTGFEVRSSDLDLRTVRLIAPAVILEGRLAATGRLDGPLHDVTFDGTARHRDGNRPPSVVVGQVHLDTRLDTLGLATDVALDPLSFEGIRRAFPTLRSRGELRGRFRSEGTLARLAVDADLSGEIGNVRAQGFTTLLPPYWGAENLLLRFSRVDLGALTGREFTSSLNGELRVTGSIDTLRAPEGEMELALSRGRLREWVIDSVFARGASRDSMIRMDTAYAEWQGARAAGAGTLGWAAPHRGEMTFTLVADSLIGFDSLLLAVTDQRRDTSSGLRPARGPRAGVGAPERQHRHARRHRRPHRREPRVPAVPLAACGRHLHLDRRAPAPAHRLSRGRFGDGGEWVFSRNGSRSAGLRTRSPGVSARPRARSRGWTPPGAGGCATACTRSGSTVCRPGCRPTATDCSSPPPSPSRARRRCPRWPSRRWTAPVWCASPGACRRRRRAR